MSPLRRPIFSITLPLILLGTRVRLLQTGAAIVFKITCGRDLARNPHDMRSIKLQDGALHDQRR